MERCVIVLVAKLFVVDNEGLESGFRLFLDSCLFCYLNLDPIPIGVLFFHFDIDSFYFRRKQFFLLVLNIIPL